ncbi:histidine phosphatase family protein [Williamsia sterculiae]|uniref:histidine phosphatase family protein n=1 Tax=Williamsia sterculiae TaxID=1344003 RepID=UPI00117ED779
MTAEVILVRHGETSLNADDCIRRLADPPSNETGGQRVTAFRAARSATAALMSTGRRWGSGTSRRAAHTTKGLER